MHEIKRALDYIGNKFSLKCFDDHIAKWLWANCEEVFFLLFCFGSYAFDRYIGFKLFCRLCGPDPTGVLIQVEPPGSSQVFCV